MNTSKYRENGIKLLDYVCEYKDNLSQIPVQSLVEPGYLRELIALDAPQEGESFDNILQDVKKHVTRGLVHWIHPDFYAYFPAGSSLASSLADILSSGFGTIGFSWGSSPSMSELETIVMDMLAKALHLPKQFLHTHVDGDIRGGGCLQNSASDSVFTALIAARARAIEKLQEKNGDKNTHGSIYLPKLIAYTSKLAHSCVEKACNLSLVKLRILETDYDGRLTGETLRRAIETDVANGLTPFFVSVTVGTTGECSFDPVQEIGEVCQKYDTIWYHVDGAYGGSSFIVPETRHFMQGLEMADSFCVNPYKFMLTNPDGSCFWVKDTKHLQKSMAINPLYLPPQSQHPDAIDYRNFGVPLTRRFRCLKIWFVLRTYGISGIQKYVRNHMKLAKYFENLVKNDSRFEVTNTVHLGLICFRIIKTNGRDEDTVNKEFLKNLNLSKKLHLVPTMMRGKYVLRFCITYEHANEEHVDRAWNNIKTIAEQTLSGSYPQEQNAEEANKNLKPCLSGTRVVPKHVYDEYKKQDHLRDGATPILIPDTKN